MIDASALVAIMLDEPDADRLNEAIMRSNVRLTSAIALCKQRRASSVRRRQRTSIVS